MKIVRAMKQIKRLQGETKELQKRAESCLNSLEGNEFSENFHELRALITANKMKLRSLKNGVMKANISGNMFEKILLLGELKSTIDFVRELSPKTGIAEDRYGDVKSKYISQWTVVGKNSEVQSLQQKINSLTDELDEFNAKTDIIE
jgi:predicted  nucleic acid-binding Zn-ribbon protein